MTRKCVVKNCDYYKSDTFHRIPRDEAQRGIWLDLLDVPASTQGRVCSKHFKQSDFEIKRDGSVWLKRNACPLQVDNKLDVSTEVEIGESSYGMSYEMRTDSSNICSEHNYTKRSKRMTKLTQRLPCTISTISLSKDFSNFKNLSSKTFIQLGNKYTGGRSSEKPYTKTRRFKSLFGVTPEVCSIIWEKICDKVPVDFKPMHLLWGLLFLKQYTKEHERQSVLKADEKTIRKYVWVAVELLSNLNVIVWENRKHKAIVGQTEFCSLDSIDFKIKEPKPSSPKWYSPKLRVPGLRYEVGLCNQTGHIVWKNSGYPAGDLVEVILARESFTLALEPGEKTFAKKEYRNEQFFILPNHENKSEHGRIMAAHDILHKRLKRFEVLKQPFRNDLEKHPTVFNAVINLIQLMLENGEPLSDADSITRHDEPENCHAFSIEEVWVKTEPGDDIELTDSSHTNVDASIFNIKTEPVDEVNLECIKSEHEVNLECIKSEITLGDYECTASTHMTFVQR